MSPAPHAPCGGQHCPVVAMLLAPRSNPLPSHCHIPLPCPPPASARHAPMSPPLPRSPGHERRPEAGLPQDGVRSGEHRLGHTDAALDAGLEWNKRGRGAREPGRCGRCGRRHRRAACAAGARPGARSSSSSAASAAATPGALTNALPVTVNGRYRLTRRETLIGY